MALMGGEKMGKQFLVIGAGRFGTSVATTLYEAGHDVMVLDSSEELVQNISSLVTNAVHADATSEKTLCALGVENYDAAVLAISSDMHVSIMAAILLVELKAKYVVAKAQTELHGRVLKKIGVNRIVYPEQDMGKKLAHSILAPSIVDLFDLSNHYSIVELIATEDLVGKTLGELDLRARKGIAIIAILSSDGDKTNITPASVDRIEEGDIIIAAGTNSALKKIGWI
jgi:trk system potassium uptake protein